MLKQECECKGRTFFVNKKEEMIQCIRCRQRYIRSNGVWKKFQTKKEALKFLALTIDDVILEPVRKAFQTTEQAFETMGQWMKRHGIVKEKKKKAYLYGHKIKVFIGTEEPVITPVLNKKERIALDHFRNKWVRVIEQLCISRGPVIFPKNYHNGKLRGRHAAKACHSDLKKLGIETDLRWRGNGAAILKLKPQPEGFKDE